MTKKQISFWETQKTNFKYLNKSEFVSDSLLWADYKSFKKINHPLFDSLIFAPAYLFSWQDRDKTKNEFTVIKDHDELGLKLFYFILDKKDNLISWVQVAGKGSEAFYWFEIRSKFLNQDTLLQIGAITKWFDPDKMQNMDKPKGDTVFSYLIINKNGMITEQVFKEVKNLHYENE